MMPGIQLRTAMVVLVLLPQFASGCLGKTTQISSLPDNTPSPAPARDCSTPPTSNPFLVQWSKAVCENWDLNSADANLGVLLQKFHDGASGIERGPLRFPPLQMVIVCGMKPYPGDTTALCNQWESDLFTGLITKTDDFPEWTLYQTLIKNRAPSDYPGAADIRLKFSLSSMHLLSGREVMDNSLGQVSGCTGASKAFGLLLSYLGLNVRYITSYVQADYLHACGNCTAADCIGRTRDQSPPTGTVINGHQVVAVEMPNHRWRLVNSSSPTLVWGRDFTSKEILEVDSPALFMRHAVDFSGCQENPFFCQPPPTKYIVSGVFTLAQADSLLSDGHSFETLMNISVSGSPTDTTCRWS